MDFTINTHDEINKILIIFVKINKLQGEHQLSEKSDTRGTQLKFLKQFQCILLLFIS